MKRNIDQNQKDKALELVKAYFEGKDIIVKDPSRGVSNWISVDDSTIAYTFLGMFCENVDCYRVVE